MPSRQRQHPQSRCYLAHEGVWVQAKSDQRQAQHPFVLQHQRIGPQRIVQRREAGQVLATVDLDHQPVKLDVEIAPPPVNPPHHLSAWLRKAISATPPAEVQLAQRVRAIAHVAHDPIKDDSSGRALNLTPGVEEPMGGDDPLLHTRGADGWRRSAAAQAGTPATPLVDR